ncbi:TVP38/TMEM64 family protein [Psychromarinibacter halotolerans]|uniref:TVP38/TMEM64 family membrane protein n=1 Tax=Psychromarinibacter halotolerans TaxID=1775175 RepID=A0ABV7GNU7_9RHOB|nr:VTT domain-containing protein [Psychromarinibacter halotolerans]MDF0596875.1 VTT domain-containing protein [Psychromarinibacter halotolerans]
MTEATGKRTLRIVAPGAGVLLLVALVAAWLTGWQPDDLDRETITRWVAGAGPWGPLAVIALMTAAVVASPLPSAPIALAAGAAYGHYAGAAYVALGSELGAVSAFLIARGAGRGAVERMLGDKRDYGLLGSQNALTLTVFVSRLLPFVSFDAMSYAAGLSRLHFWRFALATMAGILPASFVLAHFGSVAMEGDFGTADWIVLALGLLTAVPLVLLALRGGTGANRRQTEQIQDKEHTG